MTPAPTDDASFRFAISGELMKDVNENDAKAALRTWTQALSQQAGVPIDPNVLILANGDALARAFRERSVQAATVTLQEFLVIDRQMPTTNLLSEGGANGGDIYLLLVHQNSRFTNVASLRDREILLSDSMRMSLGLVWLDVLLMREGFPEAEHFFRILNRQRKTPNIVLPVFFRTADACVVHKRGFDAMVELNPQVGKQLRVLAQSERLTCGLVCSPAGALSPAHEKITSGLMHFHESARGQQVLTLFQSDPIGPLTRTTLTTAMDLVKEHERLCRSANGPSITSKPIAAAP
jgi:hypothetical protein